MTDPFSDKYFISHVYLTSTSKKIFIFFIVLLVLNNETWLKTCFGSVYTETYHEKRFPNKRYWFQWIFIFRHYFHFKYLARARIYVNSVRIDLWMADVIQFLMLLHMLSYRYEKLRDFLSSVSLPSVKRFFLSSTISDSELLTLRF